MSFDDTGGNDCGIEEVLLSYLAEREKRIAGSLFRHVERHPHYAHELLMLAFELAAPDSRGRTGVTPTDLRKRLLAVARITLIDDLRVDG